MSRDDPVVRRSGPAHANCRMRRAQHVLHGLVADILLPLKLGEEYVRFRPHHLEAAVLPRRF